MRDGDQHADIVSEQNHLVVDQVIVPPPQYPNQSQPYKIDIEKADENWKSMN